MDEAYNVNSHGDEVGEGGRCSCPGYLNAENYNKKMIRNFKTTIITVLILVVVISVVCYVAAGIDELGIAVLPTLIIDAATLGVFIPSKSFRRKHRDLRPVLAAKLSIWRCALIICFFSTGLGSIFVFIFLLGTSYDHQYYYFGYVFFGLALGGQVGFIITLCLGFKVITQNSEDDKEKLITFSDISEAQRIEYNSSTYVPDEVVRIVLDNRRQCSTVIQQDNEMEKLAVSIRLLTSQINNMIHRCYIKEEQDSETSASQVSNDIT